MLLLSASAVFRVGVLQAGLVFEGQAGLRGERILVEICLAGVNEDVASDN